jgi:cytidylate kinase
MSNEPAQARPRGLIVAISGKSGCGNTTVSRLVAERLGLRVVNYTFKNLARDQGVSFEEICILAETDPQYDLTIDRMQVKLAEERECVLGSRLAIWLLRDKAFTVYLNAPLEVRAARIARREDKELSKALRETEARDKRDHDRYARLYGYDVNNFNFAALVVDADALSQDEVAREIVEHAAEFRGAPPGGTPPEGRPPEGTPPGDPRP